MITKGIMSFCKDYTKIENYELAVKDNTQCWILHHRLETHFLDGTKRSVDDQLSVADLKALDMYYYRPPEELIFLKRSDHAALHMKGNKISRKPRKPCSEETKLKISKANKGYKPSEETRRKLSESAKRRWQNKRTLP